jgi:hypothetical protein
LLDLSKAGELMQAGHGTGSGPWLLACVVAGFLLHAPAAEAQQRTTNVFRPTIRGSVLAPALRDSSTLIGDPADDWNGTATPQRTSVGVGILRGSLIGLLVGAAAGTALALAETNRDYENHSEDGFIWAIAVPLGALSGLVLGGIIGAFAR